MSLLCSLPWKFRLVYFSQHRQAFIPGSRRPPQSESVPVSEVFVRVLHLAANKVFLRQQDLPHLALYSSGDSLGLGPSIFRPMGVLSASGTCWHLWGRAPFLPYQVQHVSSWGKLKISPSY